MLILTCGERIATGGRFVLAAVLLLIAAGPLLDSDAAQTRPAGDSPVALVGRLYRMHQTGRGGLFERKGWARLDRYFDEPLAALLWKNIAEVPEGEMGNLDFDPLYNTQDPQITSFRLGRPRFTAPGDATLTVSFRNAGRRERITFRLRETGGGWKVSNVIYADGSDLVSILRGSPPPAG